MDPHGREVRVAGSFGTTIAESSHVGRKGAANGGRKPRVDARPARFDQTG